MDKKQDTQLCFAKALTKLMEKNELDKISTKAIVEKSGLTRQTFYRYFKDKYDLVNWYFETLVRDSFALMGIEYTLEEGLKRKFAFIKKEFVFFYQAFSSNDSNSLMHYDYEYILRFYKERIAKTHPEELDHESLFLLEMYCHGSITMTVKWVKNGQKESVDEIVSLLIEAMPERIRKLLLEAGM